MCLASPRGYSRPRADFNVFVVGDATLATFPAAATPRHATAGGGAVQDFARFLVTQVSWICPARKD